MSKKNPEYDFTWCPGCGDFGVRRALEVALRERMVRTETPMENNVVVTGIGCSGNLIHLLEGQQPFGFHGIHGRTLPVAMGIKMGNPELNVVCVAGDGDFLSIGLEHIGPQAQRNLNVCAVVLDNGIYGLTKGQSSPTTQVAEVTPTTPFGKMETPISPLELYLAMGVSYVASGFSSRVKALTGLIGDAMDHPGFAIVHVQSPCTTYNDNYDYLKGDVKAGREPGAWSIPEDHDVTDKAAAVRLVTSGGVPLGLLYRSLDAPPMEERLATILAKTRPRSFEDLVSTYKV